jgi:multiple sugar transport system permease protein
MNPPREGIQADPLPTIREAPSMRTEGIRQRLGSWARSWRVRSAFWGYVFLSPNILGFLAFSVFPLVFAVGMSFTRWDLISTPAYVGLENYRVLLLEDESFRIAVKNTLIFTLLSVPAGTAVSLVLASALNHKLRGATLYRTAYFLPVVSSTVAVALVWSWLFNPDFGIVNDLLLKLGLPRFMWLASSRTVLPSLVIVAVWRGIGPSTVIFLAGLQGIPEELYDAGKMDGANAPQLFRHITLPMLSPTTFFVIVVSIIGSFQVFDLVYIMTGGGPGRASLVIVYYIFENAFRWFRMGYAASIAFVLLIIVLVLTLLQIRLSGRWVHY